MKKLALVVFASALFLVTLVAAQTLPKTSIKQIVIFGKGLAISQTNPTDVNEVKIGVATVSVSMSNQTTNVTAGVFYFNNTKYTIKNIVLSNKTASGDIYQNDTQAGSFDISLVSKPKFTLWSGNLTLTQVYNLYILEGTRAVTAGELSDKVSDYCTAHHDDQNCSVKIQDFCQNNPQDSRCLALFRNFCRTNLGDERCRQTMKDWCINHSSSDLCKDYCQNNPLVCSLPVKRCDSCPDGYKPTADGFCAPNCGRNRNACPKDVINCPSATTTTTSSTSSTTTSSTSSTTTSGSTSSSTSTTTSSASTSTTTQGG